MMNNFSNAASRIQFDRPIYEQDELNEEYKYTKNKKEWHQQLLERFKCKPKNLLINTIPSIGWLSHYKWRKDLIKDLISGITVAIMHIPQGMGYAMLGNVPPVVGLYMAFFPILIYSFLGTSRHNSMGTFAVVCLMTGKVVLKYTPHQVVDYASKSNLTSFEDDNLSSYTPLQVATTVTFVVAILQLVMYFLRLGIVSILLSDTLVSGFTTGAAVHVLVSQIKDLFGISIPKNTGYSTVVKDTIDIIRRLPNINYGATIVSAVSIIAMVLNNEVVKSAVAKRCSFPIPIELIAIIFGTLISYFANLEQYGVKIIGDIPSGLPLPAEPSYSLVSSIIVDSLWIAIVSYTITISMALIFAKKQNYEVDANQELLAMGTSNLFGSFFSCMPISASLSRSTIQENVGGKTQVTSFVSCGILLVILLWIGPYFETLPRAVLASVIVVALKGMLMQVTHLVKFYKSSKLDALVWIVTFVTVVFVSIDVGLITGIVMSLMTIFILAFKPYTCLLGPVPYTDLYLDVNRYKGIVEIPGLKIFHYQGGINFATRNIFKNALYDNVDLVPQKQYVLCKKMEKLLKMNYDNSELEKYKEKILSINNKINVTLKCVIIDFSALSFIDQSGVSTLKDMIEEFNKIDIVFYISGCAAPMYETISRVEFFQTKTEKFKFFPTLNDAVLSARYKVRQFNTNVSVITRI